MTTDSIVSISLNPFKSP